MAGNLEEYKRLFRESHVEDQEKLFGLHIVIYSVVNMFWVMLNMTIVPPRYRWLMFYPIVGWGLLIFVHWWFYVRNAYGLCKLREQKASARMAGR
jgi:uncharacterized membrane protein